MGASLPHTLGLLGVVILVATLLSGLIQRSRMPQVAAFLAMGALLGTYGLKALDIGLDSPIFQVVATLSLAFVLFTDAVTLNLREVRQHWKLAMVVLGPGTLLSALVISLAAHFLLALDWGLAVILGAAMASTDPVLLRGILQRRDLPASARQALQLESGLNDVILLPIVLLTMAFNHLQGSELAGLVLRLFLLGPGAGVAVGFLAVATMEFVRRRTGIRRDYESIYSIGVAMSAYAAAEMLHGSGFLAAFAAGLTINWMDVELCDCFVEYGETTTELALLLCFVLLGSSLIWTGLTVISVPVVFFLLIALFGRTVVLLPALRRLSPKERWLIAWFGPRGLSTLLLVLLPIFEGAPGAAALFPLAALVTLASVLIHGGSIALLPGAASGGAQEPDERVDLAFYQGLSQPVLLDVRNERAYAESDEMLADSIRIDISHPVEDVRRQGVSPDANLVAYCTCSNEGTSGRVASQLRKAGFPNAYALIGGWQTLVDAGHEVRRKT